MGATAHGDAVADADGLVAANAHHAGQHAAAPDLRAADDANAAANDALGTDAAVVADLHLIVNLDAILDHRVFNGASVNGRGGADAHVLADAHAAKLGDGRGRALFVAGEATRLEIGEGNIFREGVTVHRGTVQDQGVTRIGSHGLFMAYVHIGHDCVVGDHVIMANNASLSGHCVVGDYANFGGYVGVPQRRRIGAHTHLAGMSLVLKDVPAYVTVAGNPAFAIGLNLEGMRRRGVSDEVIGLLRTAYKTLYRCGLKVEEACERLAAEKPSCPEVALLVDSVLASEQGIVRPRPSGNSGR